MQSGGRGRGPRERPASNSVHEVTFLGTQNGKQGRFATRRSVCSMPIGLPKRLPKELACFLTSSFWAAPPVLFVGTPEKGRFFRAVYCTGESNRIDTLPNSLKCFKTHFYTFLLFLDFLKNAKIGGYFESLPQKETYFTKGPLKKSYIRGNIVP